MGGNAKEAPPYVSSSRSSSDRDRSAGSSASGKRHRPAEDDDDDPDRPKGLGFGGAVVKSSHSSSSDRVGAPGLKAAPIAFSLGGIGASGSGSSGLKAPASMFTPAGASGKFVASSTSLGGQPKSPKFGPAVAAPPAPFSGFVKSGGSAVVASSSTQASTAIAGAGASTAPVIAHAPPVISQSSKEEDEEMQRRAEAELLDGEPFDESALPSSGGASAPPSAAAAAAAAVAASLFANSGSSGSGLEAKKALKGEKRKRNIDLFLEELKRQQDGKEGSSAATAGAAADMAGTMIKGSFDTGDPNTTNLYVGNLAPDVTEQTLVDIFGEFGDVASVKVMWPRTKEEHDKKKNCGFVSYMRRQDAEDALRELSGALRRSCQL